MLSGKPLVPSRLFHWIILTPNVGLRASCLFQGGRLTNWVVREVRDIPVHLLSALSLGCHRSSWAGSWTQPAVKLRFTMGVGCSLDDLPCCTKNDASTWLQAA
jgi:hypothetical protein